MMRTTAAYGAGRRRRAVAACTAILAVAATPAAARDWFFRPDNGAGYGAMDGTSYFDAWHLDDRHAPAGHVDWSVIRPGDTLYICGFHHSGADRALRPTVSGVAGSPIAIDGACPDGRGTDPGVLLLANVEITSDWSGPDAYGAYDQPYAGSTGTQLVEDQDDNANGTVGLKRLQRRVGLPRANWSCGSFSQDAAGAPLHYKPSDADGDGACDAPHVVYPSASDSIHLRGVNHFVLRNLVVLHESRLVTLTTASDVTIENNELRWATNAAVLASANSDRGIVRHNLIHDVASGILLVNQVDYDNANSMDGWLIESNEIRDVDQDCYYACQSWTGPEPKLSDTHGIGAQGGVGNVIERNHIHHVGGEAVVIYTMVGQTVRDNLIRYNFVHDVEDLNPDAGTMVERNERGIEHGGGRGEVAADSINNAIRYNVLARIGQVALRVKTFRPAAGISWTVTNNVVYDADTAFAWAESDDLGASHPGLQLRNNIFAFSRRLHLEDLNSDPDTAGIVISNNLFYPDGEQGVPRYEWLGVRYDTLAAWAAASGQGRESLVADPMFLDPVRGNFRFGGGVGDVAGAGDFSLAAGSPAIDRGVPIGAGTDLAGSAIRGAPDLGAYESAPAVSHEDAAANSGLPQPELAPAGGGGAFSAWSLLLLCAPALARRQRNRTGPQVTFSPAPQGSARASCSGRTPRNPRYSSKS